MLIAHHTFQHDLAIRGATQHALQPRLLEEGTHAAAFIADQQHLRNRGVDQQHLANDSGNRHYGHVAFDAGILSFIDIDDAGVVAAAGANHLCGHSAGDKLFFEGQQGLQAPRLGSIFGQAHLLQPHVFDLLLELAVLGAYSAQIKVVVPEIAAAVLDPDQTALEGGDRAHRPNADQASFFLIAAAFFDLHRQPKYL